VKRGALAAVAASAVAVFLAYLSAFLPGGAPGWAPWLFMSGSSLMLVAMMALGAARNGSIGRLRIPLALTLLLLIGGFGAALALPTPDPADPTLWLGLPPRAAIVLYGVGILPFLFLPLAYAWTFDAQALAPGELERIRDEALALRRGSGDRQPDGAA
jgi:hypothetical protein